MTIDAIDRAMGFAPSHDAPIPYMQRTRTMYQAIGYNPYRWAQYAEVPFQPLAKPLAGSRVTLIVTAAPYQEGKGDQGPGAAYNAGAKFYEVLALPSDRDHDMRISHIAYDRVHSPATDQNAWFPLPMLRRFVQEGRIGGLTPHVLGARPTAATATPSPSTPRRSCAAAARRGPMSPCSCPTARSATRP